MSNQEVVDVLVETVRTYNRLTLVLRDIALHKRKIDEEVGQQVEQYRGKLAELRTRYAGLLLQSDKQAVIQDGLEPNVFYGSDPTADWYVPGLIGSAEKSSVGF
jgi:hypothetical protein